MNEKETAGSSQIAVTILSPTSSVGTGLYSVSNNSRKKTNHGSISIINNIDENYNNSVQPHTTDLHR